MGTVAALYLVAFGQWWEPCDSHGESFFFLVVIVVLVWARVLIVLMIIITSLTECLLCVSHCVQCP